MAPSTANHPAHPHDTRPSPPHPIQSLHSIPQTTIPNTTINRRTRLHILSSTTTATRWTAKHRIHRTRRPQCPSPSLIQRQCTLPAPGSCPPSSPIVTIPPPYDPVYPRADRMARSCPSTTLIPTQAAIPNSHWNRTRRTMARTNLYTSHRTLRGNQRMQFYSRSGGKSYVTTGPLLRILEIG